MTDPINLAIEALEGLFTSNDHDPPGGVAVWRLGGSLAPKKALAALRSIKPPCQMCKNVMVTFDFDASAEPIYEKSRRCNDCTNYDKFTQMPPVCLTREK
jgi:hypothetical protein